MEKLIIHDHGSISGCGILTNTCPALLADAVQALNDGDESLQAQLAVAGRRHGRELKTLKNWDAMEGKA